MSSARYQNENQNDPNRGANEPGYCHGGQMTVVSCGNDRGLNDYWSLYNQLWGKARFYFTEEIFQLVYVQQAGRYDHISVDYDTWKMFFEKQVEPRAPNNTYKWLITRDMPYILDTRRPPGKDHFSQAFINFIQCDPRTHDLLYKFPKCAGKYNNCKRY